MQYVNRILDADYVILLQPTCPVRQKSTIENIIKIIIEKKINFAYTYDENTPDYAYEVDADGAFYAISKISLLEKSALKKTRFANCYTYDIDTPENLKECEAWLQKQK
jgi:CMP-N-acetylneuraminic acid synthetase